MRALFSGFWHWSRGAAIAASTLGLGYLFAVCSPVDPNWLYPAILIGFWGCDSSLWTR